MSPPRPFRIDAGAVTLAPLEVDPDDFPSPLPVQRDHLIFQDVAIGFAVDFGKPDFLG